MNTVEQQAPRARKERLIIQELPDEYLIYDLDRHKAHCLNRTAALVWQHCDGRRSVSELAAVLAQQLRVRVDEEVVWLALEQLGRTRLIEPRISRPGRKSVSRREVIKRIGWTAAVGLPLVTSLVAPEAVQAVSANCASFGQLFSSSVPCCPGSSLIPCTTGPNAGTCRFTCT